MDMEKRGGYLATRKVKEQTESKAYMKEWTEGRLNAFIMSTLRSGSRRYPPKWQVLDKAKTGKRINPATGRAAQFYQCESCSNEYTSKEVEVDHKEPVVPLSGWVSWADTIKRLFCKADGLQVLCTKCHKAKSKQELKERKSLGSNHSG